MTEGEQLKHTSLILNHCEKKVSKRSHTFGGLHSSSNIQENKLTKANFILSTESSCP